MGIKRVIEPGTLHRWLASGGGNDTGVWICPRRDNSGHAPVLRFTTTAGTDFAVTLTYDDLERIADTADQILAASPSDRERWIDDAARTLKTAYDKQRHPLKPMPKYTT